MLRKTPASYDSDNLTPVEVSRTGPFREGDVMDNGVKIMTVSKDLFELLYPSGTRLVIHKRHGNTQYIKSDGTEALPGESIELENGQIYKLPDRWPQRLQRWITRKRSLS